MDFNREAYLNRIGIGDAVSLTETDFEAIHRAQTYNIPFENFDIHLGYGISLAPRELVNSSLIASAAAIALS